MLRLGVDYDNETSIYTEKCSFLINTKTTTKNALISGCASCEWRHNLQLQARDRVLNSGINYEQDKDDARRMRKTRPSINPVT